MLAWKNILLNLIDIEPGEDQSFLDRREIIQFSNFTILEQSIILSGFLQIYNSRTIYYFVMNSSKELSFCHKL